MASAKRFRGGFWDWVRHPWSRFAAETNDDERRRRLTPVGEPTAEELRHLVSLLDDEETKYVARDILCEVGEPAVPFIVEALKGPQLWTAKPSSGEFDIGDFFAPYKIAIRLLEPYSPPALLEFVLPRIHDSDKDIRDTAVQCVAHLGLDQCTSPTKAALRNEETIKSALRGVRSCLSEGNGGTQGFRNAMLKEYISLLGSRRVDVIYLAEALLRLDEDNAVALLTSNEHICLENRELHKLLKILTDFNVYVPTDRILELVTVLRHDHEKYPRPNQFGACITVLVDNGHRDARMLVNEAMHSPNTTVQRYAREALEVIEGVSGALDSVLNQVHEIGLANVEHPRQVYYCVHVLDCEVQNGGFSQYFANSSGDNAAMAVKSLKEIGADYAAEIVGRALSVFGACGPSPDSETRAYQLAKLRDANFETLDGLNCEYYKATDQTLELLTRFAIQNKRYFV